MDRRDAVFQLMDCYRFWLSISLVESMRSFEFRRDLNDFTIELLLNEIIIQDLEFISDLYLLNIISRNLFRLTPWSIPLWKNRFNASGPNNRGAVKMSVYFYNLLIRLLPRFSLTTVYSQQGCKSCPVVHLFHSLQQTKQIDYRKQDNVHSIVQGSFEN